MLHTPGHTPACVTYVFDRLAFVGDTLYMPDDGTACCDLPGGDAAALYRSVRRIFALPDDTRVLACHDYARNGRDHRFLSTVGEQRRCNVQIAEDIDEAVFVAERRACDATLTDSRLSLPAIRANIAGGVLPGWTPEAHLQTYSGSSSGAAAIA